MSTETADRVQAAKLLLKQLLENTSYVTGKYAKNPFKIDKRGIGDELRDLADRIDRAQDWMGVAPAALKPAPVVEHTELLTIRTPDVHGRTAAIGQIGKDFRHTGNRKVYRVMYVTWLGATDEWGVVMQECGNSDAVPVTRPTHHLTGLRSNGVPRYEIVS